MKKSKIMKNQSLLPHMQLNFLQSDIDDLVGKICYHSRDFTEEQLKEKYKEFNKLRRLETLYLTVIFNNWKFFDFDRIAIETGWLCRNDYEIFEQLKHRNEEEDYDNYSKKYYKNDKTFIL
jgi:hypothetical protein